MLNKPNVYKFFKDLANLRRKTNRAVVFIFYFIAIPSIYSLAQRNISLKKIEKVLKRLIFHILLRLLIMKDATTKLKK